MSRHYQVTGATPGFGRSVPWSKKKTNRRFNVNVQTKRYWVPSLGRRVKFTVSVKGVKVIDAQSTDAVVVDLIARGRKFWDG